MSELGEERAIRLASIVAIDIVGFSTMSEKDQRNAARKVENLRARIQSCAQANGGRLFNTAGDGFMLEFGSAGSALAAIQDILDKRGRGEPPIRVGAHVGDVVVTATDDLLGHGVNVAARLQELAEPGTALVSAEFRSMARTSPSAAFQSRGQKPLDNIEQRVQTFEILSKRQKFARTSRRVGSMAVAAVVLAGLVYVSPTIYRFGQGAYARYQQTQQAAQQPPATPAAPQTASATSAHVEPTPASVTETAAPAPISATRAPGDVFSDCEHCPDMVVVPGGLFHMGSPATEVGRIANEGPVREVSISPFAMGKTEITFQQWDACLADGGCNGYSPPDRGWGRGNRPVTDISWQDAQAYVTWLNSKSGGDHYRLASESEWEYAARAGGTTLYPTGARLTLHAATYGSRQTTAVGSHDANAFGLFDMAGNVSEWVQDCYAANYRLAPVDGAAVNPNRCTQRVFRGGSYADRAPILRSASRKFAAPTLRMAGVGFRVARALN